MALKLNQTVFGTEVAVTRSGEIGTITGFALHQRSKGTKQFLVEYTNGNGCATEGWFCEDQLTEV